jgi:hypothetical protein
MEQVAGLFVMKNRSLASTFFLTLLVVSLFFGMLPVEAMTSLIGKPNITSPNQNQTYQSHIVPLELTLNAITENPPNWTADGLVLNYALDGRQGYHAPRHVVGIGEGEFYPPFQSSYSTTMNLPNGNHTVYVSATYWIIDSDGNQHPIEELSQFVSFVVAAPEPNVSAINTQVTSPIQNEIYQTNAVPLSFICNTNITGITLESGIFTLVLDGQQGYHYGHGYYLGQAFPPIPASFNTTMNLPDGNHTLWIDSTFWLNDPYEPNLKSIYRVSQIVNFEVSTGTNNTITSVLPLPSPTVPELSWLIILPLLFPTFIAVIFRHQKQVKKQQSFSENAK